LENIQDLSEFRLSLYSCDLSNEFLESLSKFVLKYPAMSVLQFTFDSCKSNGQLYFKNLADEIRKLKQLRALTLNYQTLCPVN